MKRNYFLLYSLSALLLLLYYVSIEKCKATTCTVHSTVQQNRCYITCNSTSNSGFSRYDYGRSVYQNRRHVAIDYRLILSSSHASRLHISHFDSYEFDQRSHHESCASCYFSLNNGIRHRLVILRVVTTELRLIRELTMRNNYR